MDVKGLTISHVKSHLQMYRSMRGDLGRQGRTSTQHKNQSFEDYDGCVDEVNDVGVHFPAACSSKPIAKESDSLYSNLSSKRARIETRSCCISKSLQCSQRITCDAVPNTYHCFYDYVPMGEKTEHKGIKESGYCVGGSRLLTHQQQQLQNHSHSLLPDFGNLSAFECPNQESDFLQVTKLNDSKATSQPMKVVGNTKRPHAKDEDVGRCELSLSLSLPNPSPQGSNAAASSASDISEAISSWPGFTNYKDCSSSSTVKDRINLDLSLALCGN